MTVVGYRRADFRGSDGHMVEGYRVYLSYEISANQGAGLATDYVYMTTARLANMGVDVESLLGRNLHIYYTKSGKVSDIVLDA